jgi:hypothetical protein
MRLAAAALALTSQIAHAAPPGMTPLVSEEQPPAPPPQGVQSYRGQTLLADGIAAGLVLVLVTKQDKSSEAFGKLGLATYALGAPIIHLTKSRTGHALVSVTMRIGLPIAGALLGNAMDDGFECHIDVCDDNSPSDEMVLGVVAGFVAASALDAIYLAKGDAPKQPEPSWSPTARATPGGFALGVRGSF